MRALKENGIYVVLLVLLMIIVIKEPSFLSLTNLSNILTSPRWSSSPSGGGHHHHPGLTCRPVARSAWRAHRGDHAAGPDQRQQGVPTLGVPIPAVILLVCVVGPDWSGQRPYRRLSERDPFITTLGTMIIVYGINSSISTRWAPRRWPV
jgi:methyl-galactoside transport system permease protein